MLPTSNQSARIYASAKTHKFSFVNSVNINDLKFRPMIDKTGTITYNATKVTLSDIYMAKMEDDIVKKYRTYVLKRTK